MHMVPTCSDSTTTLPVHVGVNQLFHRPRWAPPRIRHTLFLNHTSSSDKRSSVPIRNNRLPHLTVMRHHPVTHHHISTFHTPLGWVVLLPHLLQVSRGRFYEKLPLQLWSRLGLRQRYIPTQITSVRLNWHSMYEGPRWERISTVYDKECQWDGTYAGFVVRAYNLSPQFANSHASSYRSLQQAVPVA